MKSKIVRVAHDLRSVQIPGEKIAFISGNFNVIHPGHMRMFKFASDIASKVVVGVNADGAHGVNVALESRLEGVSGVSLIDLVIPLTEGLTQTLELLRPDFVVKGKEFEGQHNSEDSIVTRYGGSILFSSGEALFSDMALLQREYDEPNFSSVRKPLDYPIRHGFDLATVKRSFSKLTGMRVLVLGDIIIDDYVTCEPIGMSQEDPTIVVSPIETKTFVGGAGVVSSHARGLGNDVRFCTVVGVDETADYARAELESRGIQIDFISDSTRPTPRKQRFRAHNKTLLRVNSLRQHSIGRDVAARFLKQVEEALPSTDLILFSDFNYGCLPQHLVDDITEMAAARGIMMTADSQASSQMSDISRFRRMALITPTEREARLAMNDFTSGLVYLSQQLLNRAEASNVVITLASEGLLLWAGSSEKEGADRLPAFNSAPKDPAGAGDSLFTTSSLALRAGIDIWQSVYMGSLAAACQVSRVGNTPLIMKDLLNEIESTSR